MRYVSLSAGSSVKHGVRLTVLRSDDDDVREFWYDTEAEAEAAYQAFFTMSLVGTFGDYFIAERI